MSSIKLASKIYSEDHNQNGELDLIQVISKGFHSIKNPSRHK